jgi:hypothetical protein
MRFCAVFCVLFAIASLNAQQLKPQTVHDFECYVEAAEQRMEARKSFLLAESDAALNQQIVRGRSIQAVEGNGANPHKIAGGQLYDWIGAIFIPGATLERTIRMVQDYDHRDRYFPEVVAGAKLYCRTGETRFGFNMRLKEPAVIDAETDVTWERVDPQRWRCRSYSTKIRETGKEHRYLLRLYSYWRFAGTSAGVYVEGQTITLSGEFSGLTRALGSMTGISPEKSLKRSLADMRESVLKPGLEFSAPPAGLPECGAAFRPAGCGLTTGR